MEWNSLFGDITSILGFSIILFSAKLKTLKKKFFLETVLAENLTKLIDLRKSTTPTKKKLNIPSSKCPDDVN